jgi:hypothetical protein
LALVWAATTLGLHSIPQDRLERTPGVDVLVRSSGPDKVVHIALFAILGFLWLRAFPHRPLTVLAAGVLYGIALEFYQGWFIPGRSCSPADAFADAAGVALAIAAVVIYRWRRRPRSVRGVEAATTLPGLRLTSDRGRPQDGDDPPSP